MMPHFHVSSTRNRESILAAGLDWTRMGAARGIAGSSRPEVDGVFLCADEAFVGFFVRMNNTGGPVDVWAVDGYTDDQLVTSSEGFPYLASRIPADRLTLLDRPADDWADEWADGARAAGPGQAYRSSLTITLDDGTVLSDEAARAWARRAQD
jgi:hypothetical protein